MREHVIGRYGLEYGLPTIDILDLFPNFNETIRPYSFLDGTSSPVDIAVLTALARGYEHCRYLEIGTWRGASVANVAQVADKCVTISLSDDEMRRAGKSTEFIKVHRFFSSSYENIEHVRHNSHTFDYSVLEDRFDLIYVDGDHSYEGARIDTEKVFPLLRGDGSVLVWHDYAHTPEGKIRWSVLAGILDGCPEDKRQDIYHISNSLCAIYIQGDFTTSFVKFPQFPDKDFTVKISAESLNQ